MNPTNHKELALLQHSMLRVLRQRLRKTIIPVPFAAMLTMDGKFVQLGSGHDSGHWSTEVALRFLERGLATMAQQGKCKAAGVCFIAAGATAEAEQGPAFQLVLEHRDGTAYQLRLTGNATSGSSWNASIVTRSHNRFFVKAP